MSESTVIGIVGMALVALAIFLFWPRRGWLWRQRQSEEERQRIQVEDALKYLYFCELEQRRPTVAGIAGRMQVPENRAADIVGDLQTLGFATIGPEAIQLTGDGRTYALHIVRAHRLWERHLADETGYAEHEWHGRAEEAEHSMTPAEADALASRLRNPLLDPHGDPIPTATGEMVDERGGAVTVLAPGESGRITHLEDEPEGLYAQLVAEGFYPGMVVQMIDESPERVRVWADGNEQILAPLTASLISVTPLSESETHPIDGGITLADLTSAEAGRILSLSPRCRGVERRRFLDLGFVPGTEVIAEMISPSGEPTAYRVRDTLIALRKNQAGMINIERIPVLSD
ncbi:MAG: DtxR family transcriptional regulator [Ardenticatenales bacterium]|nr:DtxR family transcriptional regulator [Ardenticatenales bacterium]MCB9171872.1 DtxR family transcriptional regulator [Ardenticatenales bacterium]